MAATRAGNGEAAHFLMIVAVILSSRVSLPHLRNPSIRLAALYLREETTENRTCHTGGGLKKTWSISAEWVMSILANEDNGTLL